MNSLFGPALRLVTLAALLSICGCAGQAEDPEPVEPGGGSDSAKGTVALPDGGVHSIRPMAFDRPLTRQAAGLDKQWEEAGAAYQTGDYEASERLFGEIARSDERDPEQHDATLYRGISLLMDGRYDEAEDVLKGARQLAEESGLAGTSDNYYLGVAELAQNDLAGAGEALERAVGGPFDADARELLSALAD